MVGPRRLYRALLHLYPARFREEYGGPLEQQFVDEYDDAGSGAARAVFWLRLLKDVTISLPREFARELRQDLRYSVRTYAQRPLVSLLALTALALSIGAATGVFSVVNALLLRSLPFRDAERIVQLGLAFRAADSAGAFQNWRASRSYLVDAAMYGSGEMNLTGSADAVRVKVAETSANFFTMLGSDPLIGRAFAEGEDVPGRDAVAVISYGLWQASFGGNPRVLGSTMHLNGVPLTVIGIARPDFDYPGRTAVWTPTFFDYPHIPHTGVVFWVTLGRLQPRMTLAQAEGMFEADLDQRQPEWRKLDKANQPRLIALRDQLAGPARPASLVLLGGVGFILLIACANVANLLLTRTSERRKELVVRAALGASRARLLQQLTTESVALTTAASACALVVALWASRLAAAAQPAQLSAQSYNVLDWRVLAFALGLAALTGLLFGVFPAALIARLQPSRDLLRTQDRSSGGVRRARELLVTLQIALTLILLGGAVVMGRSFLQILGTDLGYRTDHVVTMSVSLAGTRYEAGDRARNYYREALERLRAVPGVESAGAVQVLPLIRNLAFQGDRFKLASGRETGMAAVVTASRGYLQAMSTAVLQGRDFSAADVPGSETAALVNEEFAKAAGGPASLIGKRIVSGWTKRSFTVVGIVRNVHYDAGAGVMPLVLLSADQSSPTQMTFVARVRGKTEPYLAMCRDAIQSVDQQVPVFNPKTLDQRLEEATARPRFYTIVILFFGGFALLLAVIGVYGVASYSIVQRTHELGVRISVGASQPQVRRMMLRQGLLAVAVGTALGISGAIGLGGYLGHLIAGAGSVDLRATGGAAAVLAGIAGLAIWMATQRVLKLDPMHILRAE